MEPDLPPHAVEDAQRPLEEGYRDLGRITLTQQAADAIEPLGRVEEERVAARSDDRLVEAHAALLQRIGRVGLDGAGEQPLFGMAADRYLLGRQIIARLEQGRRLKDETQPLALLQAFRRVQGREKGPAIAGPPLGPAIGADARQHRHELGPRQPVALAQLGFGDLVGKRPAAAIRGDSELDRVAAVGAGQTQLFGRSPARLAARAVLDADLER